MKILEIGAAEDINSAARRMCELSRVTGEYVQAELNGVNLIASPDISPDKLALIYYQKSGEVSEKLKSHPKWVKAQELRRQAEKLEQEANLEVNDR